MRQSISLIVVLLIVVAGGATAVAQNPTPIPAPPGRLSGADVAGAALTGLTEVDAEDGDEFAGTDVPIYGYRVVSDYPHDPEAYTQGLIYVDDTLFEGTGLKGKSTLRRVDLESGEVRQSRALDKKHFGEGIAVLGDRIYQLTWKNEICFVYDRDSFELLETFAYPTAGWGLTTDGERLIMSDGSDTLTFRDPETFADIGQVEVYDGDRPVDDLNELEYIDGEVWANVWQTDFVARIDPATGRVIAWIDLSGLLSEEEREEANVLNGIAHDPATDRVFVTGKFWPALFEIELVLPR